MDVGRDTGMDDALPVAEAARVMGISRDALYKRIRRDSVGWEKGEDGRIYVYVDTATDTSTDAGIAAAMDASTDQSALIASLEEQVSYLREVVRSRDDEIRRREEEYREEARRKDHLLAAALERIPAIEPPDTPSEPRESSETASEDPYITHAPPTPETPVSDAQLKRSWWRAFFGLE
jgi:hypothetical protein